MMECPVQCGRNAHAAPGFFLWQELPLKHPKRMRSPMPQAAFYGDWGISPTSRKSLSCHESPACYLLHTPTERRYLLRVPSILGAKKDCSRHALQSCISRMKEVSPLSFRLP